MAAEKLKGMENPLWLKRSKEEVESLVVKLAQQGISSEKIGLILRDTYGIPTTKIISGRVTEILAKHNIRQESADLSNLKKKAEKLKSHMEKNKQDKVAKRGFQITQAKITTVEKYHKNRTK